MSSDAARLLVRFDDFTGGHYGAVGARRAAKNQWGGRNMILTREGSLAPASQSRLLSFSNLARGRIRGVHWAWGVDGLFYFVQDDGDDPGQAKVRRFTPEVGVPITIEDVGSIPIPTRRPGWADLGGDIYLTSWADATYKVDVDPGSVTAMFGAEGAVPGGRAIAAYGERLYIGGLSDARFNGARGNRVIYSEPADFGNFLNANFFDAGADLTEIGALVPLADQLVVILEDQQFWIFRGDPQAGRSLRRTSGHHRGSSGIRNFENDHAVADPSQARVWFFDHVARGPASFNGAQVSRQVPFGAIAPDRTGEGRVEGNMALVGGPGEFLMDRVVMPRTEGESAAGDSLDLVRVSGAFALVEQRVLTRR